ncbi:DMT family transporter [Psychrobium sp. 1_MG-2023]|uniref:DMT family transporter n=1 Tax=Psychrobium sp. 1_MG-2023 TaxID=3062624 RepID=UPI000C327445|nr:DMT family transporter [Psychrobium sp. 1_MG-2023]MDP2560610.1 DMT family transporter [Psychrobium sp. 1_MG-2023]PKF57595.1 EamA family transporter [Alteromonadales bacterium alter-6D02]
MSTTYLIKLSSLTLLTLIAFAANSILCRLALDSNTIDPSSFTSIRLLSGAFVLFIIIRIWSSNHSANAKGSWVASLMLFVYAATFSYAYLSLDTGTGALVLFGSVQITMILLSLIAGTRLQLSEWLGLGIAFTGFVYLILPDVTTPSLTGFILMTIAGISWGVYTLKGRGSVNPLMDTAYNFVRTIPFVLVLAIFTLDDLMLSYEGGLLALTSGAITSGLGYTIWYIVLRDLTPTQAAVIQLSVPVIAAFGGVIFVAEYITPRLMIASLLVLGGIFLVILGKHFYTLSITNARSDADR